MVQDFSAERLSGWVADFCQGDAFGPYPGELTAQAEALLLSWLTAACDRRHREAEDLDLEDLRGALLDHCAQLALPARAHQALPAMCRDFLVDLEQVGRLAGGRELGQFLFAASAAYQRAVRGEVEQLRRPGSKLGRNDPCPCGSGKKYKRCCMGR